MSLADVKRTQVHGSKGPLAVRTARRGRFVLGYEHVEILGRL